MSRINLLLAVPTADLDTKFRPMRNAPRGRADVVNPTAEELAAEAAYASAVADIPGKVRRAVQNGITDHWKKAQRSGGDFELSSIIASADEAEALIAAYSPGTVILGAWNRDGTQYGTHYETSVDMTDPENPVITKTLVGTPVYPVDFAQIAPYLHDEVVYDATGTEVSRTAKLDLEHEIHIMGWEPRTL